MIAAPAARAQSEAPAPRDITLPNGLRIIALPEKATELVAIQVFIRSAPESPEQRGIGAFVANTLFGGSEYMTGDEMQSAIGSLGGSINATWDADYTQIKALALSSSFHDAAWLVSDVLKDANFPAEAVENTRKGMLGSIQSGSLDLYQTTYDMVRAQLYDGTPRASLIAFDPDAVAHLQQADLVKYYDRTYIPRNIVISVVGNVDPDTVQHEFTEDLSDFPRTEGRRAMEVPSETPTVLGKPVIVKKFRGDITAAYIMAGYLAPGAGSEDFVPMQVANALLGGMKTSRLFTDLREKQGYGYQVASTYNPSVGTGDLTAFIVTGATKTDATGKDVDMISTVRDALLDEIKQFRSSKPTDTDLARAKRFLIGAYAIAHERLEDRAYYLGYSEIAQKDLGGYEFDTHYADYVNAVTADDVQRVAQEYLGDGCVIAMLLPGDPNAGVISK